MRMHDAGAVPVAEVGTAVFRHATTTRLYENVVTQIIDLIAAGHFQLGSRLPPERAIAEQIGVSRNVLREAFRVLEQRGIIHSRQGGGRYVRAVDPAILGEADRIAVLEMATILDVLEARRILEGGVGVLAAERITEEGAAELRRVAVQGMSWQDNVDFHVALASCTHNFLLERLVRQHLELLKEARQREHYRSVDRSSTLLREHLQIAEAVIAHDGEGARRLVVQHLGHTQDSLEMTTRRA